MCRGESLSIDRVILKCSGMRYSMVSYISSITYTHPDSDRYEDKTLWGWFDMQSPGDGTKRSCFPEVGYSGYGSKEKALRRCISRIYFNLVAQYTAVRSLWFWYTF